MRIVTISYSMKKEYLEPTTFSIVLSAKKFFMASYRRNASGSNLNDPTELTDEEMNSIFG